MARSLARNTRVFVSTVDDSLATKTIDNLFEIKVLDGYSFSQDAATQEIGVNEAGTTPVRGTLGFNTALNPVDVSFSTYVRAYTNTLDSNNADAIERVLWGSAMGTKASWDTSIVTPAAGEVIESKSTTSIKFGLGSSNTNLLMPLTLYFMLEQTTYVITDFNVSSGEVDFSIDGIATINWSGNGSRVREDLAAHNLLKNFGADTDYKAVPATSTKTFLRNKLSTLEIRDLSSDTPTSAGSSSSIDAFVSGVGTIVNFGALALTADMVGGRLENTTVTGTTANDVKGWGTIIDIDDAADTITVAEDMTTAGAGTEWGATNTYNIFKAKESAGVYYSVPITGATLTLENNFTYLTPEELAIVNLPLAGFAGNRVISGSLTAYLNTGATGTGGMLQDMLAKIEDSVSNNFELIFHMGNGGNDTPRVDFTIAHANVSVPTTNVEDIIATEITFTGKPWDTATGQGSFEDTSELTIEYFDAA